MSTVPPIRRLTVEDFHDQRAWIGKLFQPINSFMESAVSALSRRLTIRDNMAADLVTITLTAAPSVSLPYLVPWTLAAAPTSVQVGKIARLDGSDISGSLTAAPGVLWTWSGTQLQLQALYGGVSPTSAVPIVLTLNCWTS